ncbi:MAG: hypothetical protein RIR67_1291 [Bacteroidota bacterium]|jgi:hypothetical protein
MKINIKTLIYLYTIALFLLTFLLARDSIRGLKTGNFDFISLIIYAICVGFFAFKINRLGKISNSKND